MPCRAEAPHLEKDLWEAFRDRGLLVVGVDLGETPEKVREFEEKYHLTFPLLVNPDGNILPTRKGYGGIPYNVVVDEHMVVRFAGLGFDPKRLGGLIADLLAERPASSLSIPKTRPR